MVDGSLGSSSRVRPRRGMLEGKRLQSWLRRADCGKRKDCGMVGRLCSPLSAKL